MKDPNEGADPDDQEAGVSTAESLISPAASKLVGAEQARATGIVEKRQFQRWAAAVKDRNADDVLVAEARSSMIARPLRPATAGGFR